MAITFSKHCIQQIQKRGITKEQVLKVVKHPEKIFPLDEEVSVYQALTTDRKYLLRIFVNRIKNPNIIITAYKTSKLDKYEN